MGGGRTIVVHLPQEAQREEISIYLMIKGKRRNPADMGTGKTG